MDKSDIDGLLAKNPKVKYGCAKRLLALAKENPTELYPHIDSFVALLDSENQIIKWTAIQVIGHLARVDEEKRIDRLIPKLVGLLDGGKLITANNAIFALAEIAYSKPEYRGKIVKELLRIENYNYDTVECRNVALGKVILALGRSRDEIGSNKEVLEFLERQTRNTRNATRKKAHKLLSQIA